MLFRSQEVGNGDRLLAAPRAEIISYVPRSPAKDVSGHVLSIYDGLNEGGAKQVITISRGKADGLEVGHVLALWSAGKTVKEGRQLFDRGNEAVVTLPDERTGLVFVFRTFDRVSYGLVMSSTNSIKVGDVAKKP